MAKATKPSERLAAKELQLRIRRIEVIGAVVGNAIKVGGVVACMYFVWRSVDALAGLRTFANIGITGKLQISAAVSWLVGGSGMAYGWRQRKLRHDVNERLGARVSQLEAELDKRRSSSRLTQRGETNPKDNP